MFVTKGVIAGAPIATYAGPIVAGKIAKHLSPAEQGKLHHYVGDWAILGIGEGACANHRCVGPTAIFQLRWPPEAKRKWAPVRHLLPCLYLCARTELAVGTIVTTNYNYVPGVRPGWWCRCPDIRYRHRAVFRTMVSVADEAEMLRKDELAAGLWSPADAQRAQPRPTRRDTPLPAARHATAPRAVRRKRKMSSPPPNPPPACRRRKLAAH